MFSYTLHNSGIITDIHFQRYKICSRVFEQPGPSPTKWWIVGCRWSSPNRRIPRSDHHSLLSGTDGCTNKTRQVLLEGERIKSPEKDKYLPIKWKHRRFVLPHENKPNHLQ
jgi:hypothetical protein